MTSPFVASFILSVLGGGGRLITPYSGSFSVRLVASQNHVRANTYLKPLGKQRGHDEPLPLLVPTQVNRLSVP